jgi:hypothetical protein
MCLLQGAYGSTTEIAKEASDRGYVEGTIFNSHLTAPYKIECPANVHLKRVPPRICVLLVEN